MTEVEPIQFGTFIADEIISTQNEPYLNSDALSFLESAVYTLQQEKTVLIQTLIERENQLQQEKDEFTASMSGILHKKKQECEEYYNQYEAMRKKTELLKIELETLKNEDEKKSLELSNNTQLNDEIKQLRESYKKLYEKKLYITTENSTFRNEILALKKKLTLLENDLTNMKTTKKSVKMCSVEITCNMDNDVKNAALKTLHNAEKKLADMDTILSKSEETIRKLNKELDNERSLSSNLNKTITEKVDIMHREKDLRQDFEQIANAMRMYLEIEMMKLNAAIMNAGFGEFAKTAFEVYKGYCDGKLETIINNVVEERKKVPRSSKNPVATMGVMSINEQGVIEIKSKSKKTTKQVYIK